MKSCDTRRTRTTLEANGRRFQHFSLPAAEEAGLPGIGRLPFSLKIVLENLLRHEDDRTVTAADIDAVGRWLTDRTSNREIAFHPTRVLMPDSSGVPLFADLAAMRDAIVRLGGNPSAINPLTPVDLVIDHSVIVDVAANPDARRRNLEIEYARNGERYAFLRWAQDAFDNVRIVPPGNGICHQVNLEFLAKVVWSARAGDEDVVFPDSVLGMDSHTPMINALGILGWGCGGIEAGAAMLGQPVSMRLPEVIGCRILGRLREGVTSTDLVLTITQALRAKGVVQKFVEFCGSGLDELALPDRATIANMAPEYGATVGFFPIDRETLAYLTLTGREDAQVQLVERYARAQGLWRETGTPEPVFTDVVEIDLGTVEPSLAGPRRPQDRVRLSAAAAECDRTLEELIGSEAAGARDSVPVPGREFGLRHGDVAVAAITSCTNTSNPSVMLGAGLLARNAVAKGLQVKPWVKTSLAPGSRVVADYLAKAGLQDALDALGFHLVGFGCTTCMGNSGPLDEPIAKAIEENDLVVAAVLSGNRNFEGRVHPQCRVNYLASPPLVVAYAIAGSLRVDLHRDPLGHDADGRPVYLADIWPSSDDIRNLIHDTISAAMFRERYAHAFEGGPEWQSLPVRGGATFSWDEASWYIRRPPFFEQLTATPEAITDVEGARPIVMLGDSVTTDHISPVGVIAKEGAAGQYLMASGIPPKDFNSYAARRVNHDVMLRGTFGNIRLRNEMAPGTEGGYTRHLPDGQCMTVFDAAMRYRAEGVPLVVVAGKDYGAGSSRDWAAKGTRLLGVRAVIAEGFERIHRSNLIGMGVLPLQFREGQSRKTLGLDGSEVFDIEGVADGIRPGMEVACRISREDGASETITLLCRLDTVPEVEYYLNGGILHYTLRRMLADAA